MKNYIHITGSGISSKLVLMRKMRVYKERIVEDSFNNFTIEFPTKKEAVKILSEAFQYMRSDENYRNFIDYSRGRFLSYDAGTARISNKK